MQINASCRNFLRGLAGTSLFAFCDADYTMREKAQLRLVQEAIDFDMYRVPFYTVYRKLFGGAELRQQGGQCARQAVHPQGL